MLKKIQSWYRGLPDKKKYIEFFTALLTIPVLLTLILNNIGNIQERNQRELEGDTPAPQVTILPVEVERPIIVNGDTTPATPSADDQTPTECKREVGPVSIVNPSEGQVIDSGTVGVDISYTIGEYCAVAWSYRIDGGPWSEFTDKSLFLHGLEPGQKFLELRVRSIASDDEELLSRSFTVTGPTPTEATTSGQQ